MTAKVLLLSILVGLAICSSHNMKPEDIRPPPRGNCVADTTGLVDDSVVRKINSMCREHEKKYTDEIAVVVIQSMHRNYQKNIEHYATQLFDLWGIGKKETNNGVLLLWSIQDREARIQTGRGAKERLSDWKAQRIMDNYIVDEMKKDVSQSSKVTNSVLVGVKAVIDTLEGGNAYTKDYSWIILVLFGLLIAFGIGAWIRSSRRESAFLERMRRLEYLQRQQNGGPAACAICLAEFTEADLSSTTNPAVLTRCNHPFHFECIKSWVERNNTCPLCRAANPTATDIPRAESPPRPPRWSFWPRGSYYSRGPYYNVGTHHFNRFDQRCWGGYSPMDYENIYMFTTNAYPDITPMYNCNWTSTGPTYCRRPPPPSSSSSSKSSYSGGSSRGGGGASGRW